MVIAIVSGAIKAATAILGAGKILAFIPPLLAALAYFNYDLFDPESRPIDIGQNIRREYDFIVIGAGGAGNVVANRLTEVPDWSVLLLEAGGHESEITDIPLLSLYLHKSRLDWKYRTQSQNTACQAMKDKRCCWTRGKVLGGSTVLNTMLYIRGNKRDFDNWEAQGNPGWSYEDVLPYFTKSEDQRNPYLAKNKRYHGTGGYYTVQDSPYYTPIGLAFLQAGEEMGYEVLDVNGQNQTGFALYQFTMRRGSRCSTAKAFLRPIRLRPNFHLSIWSHVTKILIDPNTKRAYGVEFVRDGQRRVVYAKKEVILSAGAINSPQLLMVSGVGPSDHLKSLDIPVVNHLPGVGENLQDHIAVGGLIFLIDHQISVVLTRLNSLNSAVRYALLENGPLTSSVGLETVGFITTKYGNQSDDWPDIEFMLTSASTPSDGGDQIRKAHGLSDSFYNRMFKKIENRDMVGVFPMMLRPRSRGNVKLKSKDPMRYPILTHNYLTDPQDVRVLREGVKHGIALGETQAMKRLGARFHRVPVPNCEHLPQFTDEYWECVIRQYTMTIYHMSGTAKMGPISDPYSVVDPRLRVHGIIGLRVIDASIMPTITSGNIQAPVVMIAEKGSDMIKEEWLGSRIRRSKTKIRTKRKKRNSKNSSPTETSPREASPTETSPKEISVTKTTSPTDTSLEDQSLSQSSNSSIAHSLLDTLRGLLGVSPKPATTPAPIPTKIQVPVDMSIVPKQLEIMEKDFPFLKHVQNSLFNCSFEDYFKSVLSQVNSNSLTSSTQNVCS